jgi:hypothetical protein
VSVGESSTRHLATSADSVLLWVHRPSQFSSFLADHPREKERQSLARASQWIEDHNLDVQTLWWGIVWIAASIGLIVVVMALAAAA